MDWAIVVTIIYELIKTLVILIVADVMIKALAGLIRNSNGRTYCRLRGKPLNTATRLSDLFFLYSKDPKTDRQDGSRTRPVFDKVVSFVHY